MELRGKIVIVTGASSGIGRRAAELFAEKGAHVVLTARREERLRECERQAKLKGGSAEVWCGDIADEKGVNEMVAGVMNSHGQIDILVNNAAYSIQSSIVSAPTDVLKRLFEVNVFGYFYAARAVIPHMAKQKSGHIMNVSSMVIQTAIPFLSYYTSTKGAISAWSRCMRAELEPLGITVSEVYPGLTDTEFHEVREFYMPPGARRFPGTGVSPEGIARAIVHAAENPTPEVYDPDDQ